ncbi:unnamed protein product [Lactuca virosa]|uniref:TFIIS N-terminal domain-containing protein n=1 Tax=Lactuca virosa TaxID=75947 RepID=A0AAU9NTB9_9ASTR|nr:unnamed protein product [Lactuca virosa]
MLTASASSSSLPFRILYRYIYVPKFTDVLDRFRPKTYNSSKFSVLCSFKKKAGLIPPLAHVPLHLSLSKFCLDLPVHFVTDGASKAKCLLNEMFNKKVEKSLRHRDALLPGQKETLGQDCTSCTVDVAIKLFEYQEYPEDLMVSFKQEARGMNCLHHCNPPTIHRDLKSSNLLVDKNWTFVAEEDAELNRQSKPAINKHRKLPLLTKVLSKKQLQLEFLDHGVLTLLKNWLEPLPDGSLPNINICAEILKILTEFPIDLDQYDRREQLKKSGLGKGIMFLSKFDEETTSNRKLAKDLVDKWVR